MFCVRFVVNDIYSWHYLQFLEVHATFRGTPRDLIAFLFERRRCVGVWLRFVCALKTPSVIFVSAILQSDQTIHQLNKLKTGPFQSYLKSQTLQTDLRFSLWKELMGEQRNPLIRIAKRGISRTAIFLAPILQKVQSVLSVPNSATDRN